MKRTLAMILSVAMASLAITGCSSNIPPKDGASTASPAASAAPESAAPESAASTPAAAGGALKTGFAVISSVGSSKDASDEDGLAQTDSNAVAVLVDQDGRIVNCMIDAAQTKINFSKEGKLVTDIKTEFKTKNELGADYGMHTASSIGKDWNEEAAALAAYVTGKTIDEVKGIAVNEKGEPTDAELAASVTVSIGDYIAAIEKAVKNAQDMGAKPGDKLGLGIATNMEKSTDAGEKDGLAQAYSTYAAVTFGADGKVTSCVIDGSQCNVNFDKTGKITSDLKAELKTKNELGVDYGMKKASSIGKEWNEEAATYAAYAVGKTADEIKGVAVNAEGAPSDAELAASVTVSVGGFNSVIAKAAANAK